MMPLDGSADVRCPNCGQVGTVVVDDGIGMAIILSIIGGLTTAITVAYLQQQLSRR